MLESKIESILFVSSQPLKLEQLARLIKRDKAAVEVLLEKLKRKHNQSESGMQIIESHGTVQMVSNPANAAVVEEFLNQEVAAELTRPQLETLTVIAYRGPMTKLELESIRGVNCSLILRNLLIKGLIEVEEDKIIDNNQYRISLNFMRHLGINEPTELPNYAELSQTETLPEALAETWNQGNG